MAGLGACAQPIAIGFLGALERADDPHRSVRKLTLRLREKGWRAESYSHRDLRKAKRAVMRALAESEDKRVVIFGQSMGGGATVKLARYLEAKHVPVLLTVQVDSFGLHDSRIPGNVRAAANFYQREWFTIWGEGKISAADPTRTRILGNFEYEYPLTRVETWPESWPRRVFGGGHARMEADPRLWARIEALIEEAGATK